MNIQKATLVLCSMVLCVDVCLGQKDCTGVDCPVLQNCIETVLKMGACCPTCVHKGCTCEGYQYYDCVQAGFRQGKVPEGKSYFVDFGSTECSCPQGGGKISCHFIPCPEIPPNCIEISQPADGCQQCGRLGCTHGNKKYEAGHSFQLDRCQVCHCPNEGGKLMCSPVPDCDPNSVNRPIWVKTENRNPVRDINSDHVTPVEPFSKLTLGNTLPLYKQDPPSFGTEDYDYTPAEPSSSTIHNLAQPLESTTVPLAYPDSSSASLSSNYDRRHELREPKKGPNPVRRGEDEVTHNMDPVNTRAQSETSTLLRSTTTQRVATASHTSPEEISERTHKQNSDRVVQDALNNPAHAVSVNKESRHKQSEGSRTENNGISHSVGHKRQEKTSAEHKQHSREERFSTIQFRPTSTTPIKMSEIDQDQPQRQPQTLFNYQAQDVVEDTEGKKGFTQLWPEQQNFNSSYCTKQF